MNRSQFNLFFTLFSASLAVFSLFIAYKIYFGSNYYIYCIEGIKLGKVLVAIWVIGPPVFFWFDWVIFCKSLPTSEKEDAKHTHDLGRNIWLALVGILAVAVGIKF